MRRLPALAALALLAASNAEAGMILDYRAHGTFTTSSPLTIGGVTATETRGGTLVIDGDEAGLGVLGGNTPANDQIIDGNESVLFRFDAGPATAVGFTAFTRGGVSASPDIYLEGFGAGGNSLGTVTFTPGVVPAPPGDGYDVSARFGGVALSAFRIFGNGSVTGLSISTVGFTPEPAAVATPEPGAVALVASSLPVGLIFWLRRRKAVAA